MAKSKTGIRDIYEGDMITIWEDEVMRMIYVCLPYCTVNFPREEWDNFKEDINKIAEL